MENILNKEYAEFLENTLKNMTELPVQGICIMTKMKNGGFYTSCYNIDIMDKIACAGLLQQDAMLEMLQKNKLIKSFDERDEEADH